MTIETAGTATSPREDSRADLLRHAAKRSMVLGQVMRRAVQGLRSEVNEYGPSSEESARVTHDPLPEIGEAQFFVLFVLADAGSLAVGEIAERCHVSGPTISRMLNHLEANQLIERHIDPKNRRVIRVVLTEAGRAAEADMTRRFEAALENVLSPLTDAELADLITAFGHLERLVADAESTPARRR